MKKLIVLLIVSLLGFTTLLCPGGDQSPPPADELPTGPETTAPDNTGGEPMATPEQSATP
ncbi:MAG: hypothetical protein H7A21_05365 [Spirochaetales bacterium]|nr:hypothetical protein [Leptospiraceae bacterium]MCP5480844.1 hypothetical protein [Spirochaetales bacterium]